MLRTQTGYLRATKASLTAHATENGLAVRNRITTELDIFKDRFGPTLNEIDRWAANNRQVYDALRPQSNCWCMVESVDGDKLHILFSKMLFHRDEKRNGVMIYILGEETARAILVYTSLSQGVWRAAPYGIWGRHFGKTDNEDKMNLPLSVHEVLDNYRELARKHGELSFELGFDLTILQPDIARAREMCQTTECLQKTPEVETGRVIEDTKHFEGPWVSWPVHGYLKRVSFLSRDGNYRYHFLVSPLGFSLASVEERSPFSKYGLRPLPNFATNLIAPLIEYDVQIRDPLVHVNGHYYAPKPERLIGKIMGGDQPIMTRDALVILHDIYTRAVKKVEMAGEMTEMHTQLKTAWDNDVMEVLCRMG